MKPRKENDMNTLAAGSIKPWYREPWPWILMSGPAIVIVAGFVTLWYAITYEDALVTDDYYKQGLAINRTLAREEAAVALGVEAKLMFSGDGASVRVSLGGRENAPDQLVLRFAHATRAGLDQRIDVVRVAGGWYEGRLVPMHDGKWKVMLEDPTASWRVTGMWVADADDALDLRPQVR
jgi:hypothetical protein